MAKSIRITEPETPDTIPPWQDRKIWRRTVIGLIIIICAFLVGLLAVYPRVEAWKNERLLRLAEQYLAKEDYRSAYLLLEPFVQIRPTNYTARRMLAKVYDAFGSDQALSEWESLAKSEPQNPANYVGLATAVLKVGQTERLPQILQSLGSLTHDSLEYHRLAAASALASGDLITLSQHLVFLAKNEPDNILTRFSLAVLQLGSAHSGAAAQARLTLTELAQGDGLRVRATLALINDAPRRWPDDNLSVRNYARLADELKLNEPLSAARYVSIQGYAQPPDGLTSLIAHMKAQPSLTANDAVMLAQWLLQIGRGREALFWLDTLNEPLRGSGVVRQCMATCAAALESWPRLEQLLIEGVWGPLPAEAIKQAFVARTLRADKNNSKAGSQWSGAVRLCEQSLPGLQALQRLAQIWRWPDRQAQVLWVIVRQFPAHVPAWHSLVQLALAEANSNEVWRIYQAWVAAVPSSAAVQAERILFGLLIRTGETGFGPQAEELFQRYPEIPVCRVAQALALWRSGHAVEAQRLLDASLLNFQRNPRFALVNGLILATLGNADGKEKMFALAQTAKLLPEEQALMAQARRGN